MIVIVYQCSLEYLCVYRSDRLLVTTGDPGAVPKHWQWVYLERDL